MAQTLTAGDDSPQTDLLIQVGSPRTLLAVLPHLLGFRPEEVDWEESDSLAAEHAAFVASVLNGARVVVDATAGRRALAAALMIIDNMRASRERMMASGLIAGT